MSSANQAEQIPNAAPTKEPKQSLGLTIQEEMQFRAKLHRKITDVAHTVGVLTKDGHNKFDGYYYLTYDAIMKALVPALYKIGLSMDSEVTDWETRPAKTSTGKPTQETVLTAQFVLVDCETGYQISKIAVGIDQDNKGRSFSQAYTSCVRSFCIKTFKIASVAPNKSLPRQQKPVYPSSPPKSNLQLQPKQPSNNSQLNAKGAIVVINSAASLSSLNIAIETFTTSVKQAKTVMAAIAKKKNEFISAVIKEIEGASTMTQLDKVSAGMDSPLKKVKEVIEAGKKRREELKSK